MSDLLTSTLIGQNVITMKLHVRHHHCMTAAQILSNTLNGSDGTVLTPTVYCGYIVVSVECGV
jgi:hypothetical protein